MFIIPGGERPIVKPASTIGDSSASGTASTVYIQWTMGSQTEDFISASSNGTLGGTTSYEWLYEPVAPDTLYIKGVWSSPGLETYSGTIPIDGSWKAYVSGDWWRLSLDSVRSEYFNFNLYGSWDGGTTSFTISNWSAVYLSKPA